MSGVGAGVISGAMLFIRGSFRSVDRETWLQVNKQADDEI